MEKNDIGIAFPAKHGEEGHRCSGFCEDYEKFPTREPNAQQLPARPDLGDKFRDILKNQKVGAK